MPRLRHLKNFNFNPNDFVVREPIFDGGGESGTPTEWNANSARDSDFSPSGEHWLSNNRVVGSLAKDEIETAIKYHEVQISLLREELDARASGLRQRELFPNWEPLAREERLRRGTRNPKAHSARASRPKLSRVDKVLRSLLKLEIPLTKLEILLKEIKSNDKGNKATQSEGGSGDGVGVGSCSTSRTEGREILGQEGSGCNSKNTILQ